MANRFVSKKYKVVIENYQFNTNKWHNRIYSNDLILKIFDYLYEQLLINGINSEKCIQLQKLVVVLEQFTLEDLSILFNANLVKNNLVQGPLGNFINDIMKG